MPVAFQRALAASRSLIGSDCRTISASKRLKKMSRNAQTASSRLLGIRGTKLWTKRGIVPAKGTDFEVFIFRNAQRLIHTWNDTHQLIIQAAIGTLVNHR